MGQLALALRSFAVKATVFVALAAGFAWMLGGQLFPGWRAVHLDAVRTKLHEWSLVVEGHASRAGEGRWRIERTRLTDDDSRARVDLLESLCTFALGPVLEEDRVVVFARGMANGDEQWWRVTFGDDGSIDRATVDAPFSVTSR